jgi:hypothetical protein
MSNVNDNNLDDLLRRAAEKYPLRTDSADWGRLVADLDNDPSMILPPAIGEDRRRRRRFFWLFLLLPLAGAGYYIAHVGGANSSIAGKTNIDPADKKGQNGGLATPAQGSRPGASVQNDPAKVNGSSDKAKVNGSSDEAKVNGSSDEANAKKNGDPANLKENSDQASAIGQTEAANVKKQDDPSNIKEHIDHPHAIPQTGTNSAGRKGRDGRAPMGTVAGAATGAAAAGSVGAETGAAAVGSTGAAIGTAAGSAGSAGAFSGANGEAVGEADLRLARNNVPRANTKKKDEVVAIIPVNSNATGQAKNENIKLQKPKPSFYVGALVAPDFSTVKWQSVKNVGTRFGLLLGYSFNNRWSIESGVYYSKKKYFTEGEYFDKTSSPAILKHIQNLEINGVCNMWEFPVNVRYNLSTGESSRWFATAGLSAYHMSSEKYNCWGSWYGTPWHENWDTASFPHAWSVNLNISVGYEQRLGKIGRLRLEPYVRVPMSGIGTGKLSIMSAGLNIGITRRIW